MDGSEAEKKESLSVCHLPEPDAAPSATRQEALQECAADTGSDRLKNGDTTASWENAHAPMHW